MTPCTADPRSLAEAYLLSRMSPEEATAFEDHYIMCPKCAGMLEREEGLIDRIRAGLRALDHC
jgi:hypothetical protein